MTQISTQQSILWIVFCIFNLSSSFWSVHIHYSIISRFSSIDRNLFEVMLHMLSNVWYTRVQCDREREEKSSPWSGAIGGPTTCSICSGAIWNNQRLILYLVVIHFLMSGKDQLFNIKLEIWKRNAPKSWHVI